MQYGYSCRWSGCDNFVTFKRNRTCISHIVQSLYEGKLQPSTTCCDALLIRTASENELDDLTKIDLACKPEGSGGWSKEVFKDTLSQAHAHVLVACLHDVRREHGSGGTSFEETISDSTSCTSHLQYRGTISSMKEARIQTIAGFISGSVIADELQIENLAVDKSFRGRSVGETLLRKLLKEFGTLDEKSMAQQGTSLDRCILEVKEGNVAALGLYKKLGFTVTGKRRNFYPDGSAALLMELSMMKLYKSHF